MATDEPVLKDTRGSTYGLSRESALSRVPGRPALIVKVVGPTQVRDLAAGRYTSGLDSPRIVGRMTAGGLSDRLGDGFSTSVPSADRRSRRWRIHRYNWTRPTSHPVAQRRLNMFRQLLRLIDLLRAEQNRCRTPDAPLSQETDARLRMLLNSAIDGGGIAPSVDDDLAADVLCPSLAHLQNLAGEVRHSHRNGDAVGQVDHAQIERFRRSFSPVHCLTD